MEGSLIQLIDHQKILAGVEANKLLGEFLQAAELTGEMERSVSFVIFPPEQERQNGSVGPQPVQDWLDDQIVSGQDRDVEDVSLININHPEQLVQLSIINFLSEVIEDVQVFVENGRYQWGLVLMIRLITVCTSENNIF